MGGEEDGEVASLFVRDGLLFPVPVLTAEEADFYRLKYEDYVRRYGGGGNRVRGNKIFRLHLLAPWAARLVRHNRLLAAVRAALGCSSLLIWSSDLTVKPASSSECFGWHQDCAYADLGPPDKLLTAWLALSESTEENGCVQFVPGSHRLGELRHREEERSADRNLVLGQTVVDHQLPAPVSSLPVLRPEHSREAGEAGGRAVLCRLQPGQASLHGWRTLHSSQPNTSTEPRLGLAIRFMCGETVRHSRPAVVRDRVSLACGEYVGDWFEVEPEPVGEFGRTEWAEHKLSMTREWERRKLSKQLGRLPSHRERTRLDIHPVKKD